MAACMATIRTIPGGFERSGGPVSASARARQGDVECADIHAARIDADCVGARRGQRDGRQIEAPGRRRCRGEHYAVRAHHVDRDVMRRVSYHVNGHTLRSRSAEGERSVLPWLRRRHCHGGTAYRD